MSGRSAASFRPRYLKNPPPFLPTAWRSTTKPCFSSVSILRRASLIRFALNAPARPRFDVMRMRATRFGPPLDGGSGRLRRVNWSARSGDQRSAMVSASAAA
jgi:hypothetical protein